MVNQSRALTEEINFMIKPFALEPPIALAINLVIDCFAGDPVGLRLGVSGKQVSQRVITKSQFQHRPTGQIVFHAHQQLMKRLMPEGVTDRASDVFAEPCRAGRFAMAPDTAAPGVFEVVWAVQVSAAAKRVVAAGVEQRKDRRMAEP